MLEPNPEAVMLDLGCGDSSFTTKAASKIRAKEVVEVDVDDEALEKARRRGIRTVKHDLNIFPYPFEDNAFDVIVSNQVIEHLWFPHQVPQGSTGSSSPGATRLYRQRIWQAGIT